MKLPAAYKPTTAGFTLIETLIAMAVAVVLLSGGLYVGYDQYQSFSLKTERDVLMSVLQKARSQAMNNIDQAPHGLSVQANNFVLFEGSSYAGRNTSADESIPRNSAISETGLTEVVFSQLSGDTSASGTFTLSIKGRSGSATQVININAVGQITQ